MIRVVIVDDHTMVRAGLRQLLGPVDDIEVVGEAATGAEAIDVVSDLRPDLVLLDISMPVMDGLTALPYLKRQHPEVKVVILTTFEDPNQVSTALAAGAAGYLLKDVEREVLVAGIRGAMTGGAPLSPSVAAGLLRAGAPTASSGDSLTRREHQILRLIVAGRSNREIGDDLGIAEKTVKSHCGRLFQRLGVADRTQAAVWAMRNLPAES